MFIHFIDSEYHWYASGLCVVDSLNSLWHNRVIGSDDDDRYIRHFGTAGTHCGKGCVSRSIQESDVLSVFEFHIVCTDVLCDTACLSSDHIGITDMVEQ